MTEYRHDPERDDGATSELLDATRKVYQRPQILFREPLEAMAAACGSAGGKADPVSCSGGPISS